MKQVRRLLDEVHLASVQFRTAEENLIEVLKKIDDQRIFVRVGYKSLRGFCNKGLHLSKFHSQRIATAVRRFEPVVNIGSEGESAKKIENG
jgi:hypothetical protein